MNKVKLLYVGIGGYGVTNLDRYLSQEVTDCELAGVVDVAPEKSYFYPKLVEMGVSFYKTLDEFYAEKTADLAILSTPIQLHCPQAVFCMRHGSNVLCEKPVAATVEEAEEMLRVQKETGKFVNIGYQASYSPATLAFKKDVAAGLFGKCLSARTLVLWPRTEKYYGRSPWAGKLKGPGGEWILDSVANNATAHYLHNMFYVLSGEDNKSLVPDSVKFELYRGNPIESFDTCCVRATCGDIPLLFLVSHIVEDRLGPNIVFEFEKATVTVTDGVDHENLTATFKDGTVKAYGDYQDGRTDKVQRSIDMCLGRATSVCGVEAAMSHAMVIREFHRDPSFIDNLTTTTKEYGTEGTLHYMPGMREDLKACFEAGKLPCEMGMKWSTGAHVAKVAK